MPPFAILQSLFRKSIQLKLELSAWLYLRNSVITYNVALQNLLLLAVARSFYNQGPFPTQPQCCFTFL